MSGRITKGMNAVDGAEQGDIEIVFRCETCWSSFAVMESQPIRSLGTRDCFACIAWSQVLERAGFALGNDRTSSQASALINAMATYAEIEKPEEESK